MPLVQGNDVINIGTVGRMHGVKDQLTLVRAYIQLLTKHPSLIGTVNLLLIGDGPLREQAIVLLENNNLLAHVWLPGARADIAAIMRSLDIFVLPSQAEGISNTILEAMATGLPVLATAVGGNSELVLEGETGLLVPHSEPEAMATALLTLLENKPLRLQFGKSAHQRILENFQYKQW